MNEREPKVMTLRPGSPRDGQVILDTIVSICESARYPDRLKVLAEVRESDILSSCTGSA